MEEQKIRIEYKKKDMDRPELTSRSNEHRNKTNGQNSKRKKYVVDYLNGV